MWISKKKYLELKEELEVAKIYVKAYAELVEDNDKKLKDIRNIVK